jgi:uncharacterized membrane protein
MSLENPRSTARILGHPIHPMLVPYPIAFLLGTLVTDLIYWQVGDGYWASMSFYLLAAGIATALLAALAGFTDFLGERRIRAIGHAWHHMLGNLLAVSVSIVNLLLRLGDPAAAIVPTGLALSAVVALLLTFTGWKGGELVFRHGVGVAHPVE